MSLAKFLAADNLPSWFPLHHFNEPKYNYRHGAEVVDWRDGRLWVFVGMTVFNPVFWNTVARNEYRNKTITKLIGSPKIGCYILAATIFSLSAFRDTLFLDAVKAQPALAILNHPAVKVLAAVIFAAGQTFVLSSMWALGVTGTYLGDYFGILMSHRVTGFPFNVLNDPMYVGSALTHLGTALWYQSPAGIVLAGWIFVVYQAALRFEGPFTDKIYSASHKKTSSHQSTPTRKSSRIAHQKDQADEKSDDETIVAAVDPDAKALPTETPKKTRASRAVASARKTALDSPATSTRSRSKGRISSDVSD